MQLSAPFFQLPLRFDADRLAAEVAQFTAAEWRPHPQGHPGNSALPFIARHGNPLDDGVVGPMRPTPHLARCDYLMQVMAALDVPLGRSRLMRLDARAEATPHIDLNYYWQQRVRVHIPVVTFPSVQFLCGDASTHMAPGECWIFDTWRLHNVLNPADAQRIHLVIDTVGSASFWQLVASGGVPVPVPYVAGKAAALRFESSNYPVVMSPWEFASLWSGWMADARAGTSPPQAIATLDAAVQRVLRDWRGTWAQFDAGPDGWPHFARLRDRLVKISAEQATRVLLPNEMDLAAVLKGSLIPSLMNTGLGAQATATSASTSKNGAAMSQVPELGQTAVADAPASSTSPTPAPTVPPAPSTASAAAASSRPVASAPAPGPRVSVTWGASTNWLQQTAPRPAAGSRLVRPLIILAAPRSGSTLLFETLANARGLFTVGGESHLQFESIAALRPTGSGHASNRLLARQATPAVIDELHARFAAALRDRDGGQPRPGTSPRLLEKTPKNALRVPFLEAVFPDARYVYLYRDPEENVSSLIEGWESGNFVMYPDLPGWRGPPWSFLLVPGWPDLIGAPVPAIAAAQWQRTQTVLLDDLEALPRPRVHALTYREFLAAPGEHLRGICEFAQLDWDRALPPTLPHSRHTVSAPHPDKWRQREALIAPYRPALEAVAERARRFIAASRSARVPAAVTPG